MLVKEFRSQLNSDRWQNCFKIVSIFGASTAAILALLVKEPEMKFKVFEFSKGSKLQEFKSTIVDCMSNPVTKFTTLGSMFRMFGMFVCDYYIPLYFLKTFPAFTT